MINKEVLFTDEYLDLLCPYNIEFLFDLIGYLNIPQEAYFDDSTKKVTLNTLDILLEMKIVQIDHWPSKTSLNGQILNSSDILREIKSLWNSSSKFEDFYSIVCIAPSEWYLKELERKGLKNTSQWKGFVQSKIGNLNQWIQENTPG